MGSVHLISRRWRVRPCSGCRCLRLVGIDQGWPYAVDPVPLTLRGELKTRFAGRWTWELHGSAIVIRNAARASLDRRYGRPAVLPDHWCRPVDQVFWTKDDIEPRYVDHLRHLITPRVDPPADDEPALFSISRELGGVVVEQTDRPPF